MKLRILLLILGLVATTCCALQVKEAVWPVDTRTPGEQHEATALISEVCLEDGRPHLYRGSGVIMSDYRVLTAAHMTICEGGELVLVTVDDGSGPQEALVEVVLPDMDIARLWVRKSMHHYTSAIAIGPRPAIGERACEATAMPRPTYRCGLVQPSDDREIYVGFQAERGNSGSGVYVQGKLVGIVVRQHICEGGVACVGDVAPLQDYPWLLEF